MFRRLHALPMLCALVCWALFSAQPAGQSGAGSQNTGTTIIGSVVDASLAPLAGVAVTLERDGRVQAKTSSAADGAFRFANVAAGAYRIKAEHAGFPPFERELRVPAGAAAVRMPIVLARPTDKLDEVTVDRQEANRPRAQPSQTPPPPPAQAAPPPPPQAQAGASTATAGGGAGGGRGGRALGAAPVLAEPAPYTERPHAMVRDDAWSGYRYRHSGERYAHVEPNRFQSAWNNPLSTFGADVDTASYTNVRRFLSQRTAAAA